MTAVAERTKPRLSRLDSVYKEGAVFFVTCCTYRRRRLLATNHLHQAFVTSCSARLNLSTWIKSLKNFLSRSLREQSIEAPHWQKGFFDHVMRSEDSSAQKWEYVRLNPVRAARATDACHWRFQGEIAMLD
jgi:REP element-mobilizing transposase RayT